MTPTGAEHAGTVDGTGLRAPVSLVVAHPGHELLAFAWLERLRPAVFIVTDGSGRDAEPRIAASKRLLEGGLGVPGSVFGRWSDRQLYDALFEGRFEVILALRDELTGRWLESGVRTVICDAYERRILMHDVVHLTVAASVERARSAGAEVDLLELPIYFGADEARPGDPAPAAVLIASDATLARKIAAARAYGSPVVRREVDEFLRGRGEEGFRAEVLLRPPRRPPEVLEAEPPPEWEAHGERLVREGVYHRVIRFREHLVPLARALDAARTTAA
jgi:hypothetical protein